MASFSVLSAPNVQKYSGNEHATSYSRNQRCDGKGRSPLPLGRAEVNLCSSLSHLHVFWEGIVVSGHRRFWVVSVAAQRDQLFKSSVKLIQVIITKFMRTKQARICI